MTFKIGSKVNVYYDPITVNDLEGVAVIKSAPKDERYQDIKGRKMYRCRVRFDGEDSQYFRTVSELAEEHQR